MPIKNIRLILVMLGVIIACGRICAAGTWIDDFSDRTLRDWGHIEKSNDWIAIVNNERFNFRGKNADANFSITNWELGEIQDFSLEMKVMFRHIDPNESNWVIGYEALNKKTGEREGFVKFRFSLGLGHRILDPGNTFVYISQGVPEEHPQFGVLWRPVSMANARFAYEKEVWYTLKIKRNGNLYTFSIDDIILEGEDDSVPIGWIYLHFWGRLSIWLDDFIVTGPNVPNGGPGGLGVVMPAGKLATTWGKLKMPN